jgi:hypothetical protein
MPLPILRPPPPYVYQEWPRCFYGPNGQCEEFNSLDEVPEGWVEHPKMLADDYEEPDPDDEGEEEDDFTADEIAAVYSQDALVDMINAANTGRAETDKIEFLGNWSKVRLAQALLDGGVEISLTKE